jgi:hypothetical protein
MRYHCEASEFPTEELGEQTGDMSTDSKSWPSLWTQFEAGVKEDIGVDPLRPTTLINAVEFAYLSTPFGGRKWESSVLRMKR